MRVVLCLLVLSLGVSGCSTALLTHPHSRQTMRCPGGDKVKQAKCIDDYQREGYELGVGYLPVGGFDF